MNTLLMSNILVSLIAIVITALFVFVMVVTNKTEKIKYLIAKVKTNDITPNEFEKMLRYRIKFKMNKCLLLYAQICEYEKYVNAFGMTEYTKALEKLVDRWQMLFDDNALICIIEENLIAIFLNEENKISNYNKLCETLLEESKKTIKLTNNLDINFNINIAMTSIMHVNNLDNLTLDIHIALNNAISQGPDTYYIYKPEIKLSEKTINDISKKYESVIKDKKICLAYQPVISPDNNNIHSVEVYLKWNKLVDKNNQSKIEQKTNIDTPLQNNIATQEQINEENKTDNTDKKDELTNNVLQENISGQTSEENKDGQKENILETKDNNQQNQDAKENTNQQENELKENKTDLKNTDKENQNDKTQTESKTEQNNQENSTNMNIEENEIKTITQTTSTEKLLNELEESPTIYKKVTLWVFSNALLKQKKICNKYEKSKKIFMSINLSTRQILINNIVNDFKNIAKKCGISPSRIIFEINSRYIDIISDIQNKVIKQLREAGFLIAIDDYLLNDIESVINLKNKFDIIKLAPMSLKDAEEENVSKELLEIFVKYCKEEKIVTIAKNVETQEQNNLIKELGFDYGQGFYYAHPKLDEELDQFLSEKFN